MNRLLIRILTGIFLSLLAAVAMMFLIITPFYGRLFTNPQWYPIHNTAELVQYILDKTPQESLDQEIEYLGDVLNRTIEIVSAEDDVIPQSLKQKDRGSGALVYDESKEKKKIFFAPVHQGNQIALIDPSFQQYKPNINPYLFIMSFLVMFIAVALTGCWLSYPMNRRLNEIEIVAEKISQGDMTIRIKGLSSDLIGNVERCFNQMADRIRWLVLNRQNLLCSIVQNFKVPIGKIDAYVKELHCNKSIPEIIDRSKKIDMTINDLEILARDLLTQEKVRLSGYKDLLCGSRGRGRSIDSGVGLLQNPDIQVGSTLKIDVVKFILRMSLGVLTVMLIHQLIMLATPQIFYKYTNTNSNWYPVYSMATLIKRAVDLTPREELPDRVKAFEASLHRRLDLVPAEEAARLFSRTSQEVFAGNITYGLFKDRDSFSAPVHDGAYILMIDPAFSLYRQNPSLIYHSLTLAIEFLLTLLFGIILSVPIIRNLRKLEEGINRMSRNDLNARVDIPPNRPMGKLAGHLNDMADRIQALLEHQKDLIRSVVHEIRTPVSRIRFHLEMLTDARDEKEIDRRIGDIEEEIGELNRLVDELSTFTALDSMNEELVKEAVPLYDELKEIMDYHRKTNRHISIVLLNDADERIHVTAHPVYFRRAIQNILFNALRHARVQVSLRWGYIKEGIFIEICDDGPGIPEDARDEVFEPFTRLDHSRDRKSGGFGLGLAIVRRIISLHGGTIAIADNPPQGARVTTWWPFFNQF